MTNIMDTLEATKFLGRLRAIQALRNTAEVGPAATRLHAEVEAALEPGDPTQLAVQVSLVEVLSDYRLPERTANLATDLYAAALDALGPNHPTTQTALGFKTRYRRRAGLVSHADAVAEYRSVVRQREAPPNSPMSRKASIARVNLAIALRDCDTLDEVTEAIDLAKAEWEGRSEGRFASDVASLGNAGVTGATDASVARALEAYVRACIRRAEMGVPYLTSKDLVDRAEEATTLVRKAHGGASAETVVAMITEARARLLAGDVMGAIDRLEIVAAQKHLLDSAEADYLPETRARCWAASNNPEHWPVALKFAKTASSLASRVWGANTPHMQTALALIESISAQMARARLIP